MEINNFWFKTKKYGYGAYPSTWEGWMSIVCFIIFFSFFMIYQFFLSAFGSILLVLLLSKLKTNGEWKWRWGKNFTK